MGYEPTLMFTATRSERLFMKHLFLALLFLALEATGLRVAVAQDGNRDADPVRKIPPVRISISSLYQRWTQDEAVLSDRRPGAQRPVPANKLSPEEREEILAVSNSPVFRNLPPEPDRTGTGRSRALPRLGAHLLPRIAGGESAAPQRP